MCGWVSAWERWMSKVDGCVDEWVSAWKWWMRGVDDCVDEWVSAWKTWISAVDGCVDGWVSAWKRGVEWSGWLCWWVSERVHKKGEWVQWMDVDGWVSAWRRGSGVKWISDCILLRCSKPHPSCPWSIRQSQACPACGSRHTQEKLTAIPFPGKTHTLGLQK